MPYDDRPDRRGNSAQDPTPPLDSVATQLRNTPLFRRAEADLRDRDPLTLETQIELTEIPAPPFGEEVRGRRMAQMMSELGLVDGETDAEGNVLAWYPSPGRGPRPVVLSAHLDTVFPEGTDVRVRRTADRLEGPGIGDDGRGLAALLAIVRALAAADIRLRRPLLLAATVGEEGIGNLRGVRHLFGGSGHGRDSAAFLSLDGAGLHVIHRAIGSRRFRITVDGSGGHSWADWGVPNPLHALGDAIARCNAIRLPRGATLSVGRLEGGTSVNAIPETAWMEMEVRSEAEGVLADLEDRVRSALESAVEGQNRRRARGAVPLSLRVESLGNRPGGATAPDSPLVRAVVAATEALGHRAPLVSSSTDANVPMSLGIPAVTLGAGGRIGSAHTIREWYGNEGGPDGLARALLSLLVLDEILED